MGAQPCAKDLTDRLIDLGIKVRVLAIAVEGLGRKQDRAQDGFAISAMLLDADTSGGVLLLLHRLPPLSSSKHEATSGTPNSRRRFPVSAAALRIE